MDVRECLSRLGDRSTGRSIYVEAREIVEYRRYGPNDFSVWVVRRLWKGLKRQSLGPRT